MLKSKGKILILSTIAVPLFLSNVAYAAHVTVNRDVDLIAGSIFNGPQLFKYVSTANDRFSLSVGDTFTYNVRFLNNGSLSLRNIGIVDVTFFVPGLFPPGAVLPNTGVTSTSRLSLLDQNGLAVRTSDDVTRAFAMPTVLYSPAQNSFGAVDFQPDNLAGRITFFGVSVTGTVDSFTNPTVSSLPYEGFFFTVALNTPQGGGVPEPATWAMFIVGFGLVGASLRRRRAVRFGGYHIA
jgi:PEP-CTERM motif